MPVGPEDEATAQAHPDLVATDPDGWRYLRRVPGCGGTRCVALTGDGTAPYRCTIYPDRPSACSGLEEGSENCRFARSRVGL